MMPGQCSYQMHLTLPPAPPQSASGQTTPSQNLVVVTEQRAPVMSPSYPSTTPISRAHPGGPKWALIQQCYGLYQKALTRFVMPPLALRLPEGFRYYEGGQQMYWYQHTLLVPRQFLDHTWRHALLPELARQLLYVNAPDLWVLEFLAGYPRYASESFFLRATLNFLWLPTIVKNLAMARWQAERVLDADRFAYLLGEGMRLRSRLQREQEANWRTGIADNTFPTLDERIEHLNALISDEARQLQQLRASWEDTPSHQFVNELDKVDGQLI